jgi:hypothetical protein
LTEIFTYSVCDKWPLPNTVPFTPGFVDHSPFRIARTHDMPCWITAVQQFCSYISINLLLTASFPNVSLLIKKIYIYINGFCDGSQHFSCCND